MHPNISINRNGLPTRMPPMKHLFFVHSHITFQVALAIIEKKKFLQVDCVFMAGRGYDPKDSDYLVVALPFSDDYFQLYKNIFRGWSYLKEFDAFVSTLCKGDFIFYCPHTYFLFSPVIQTHKMCKGYCLLEEGLASYKSIVEMNEFTPPVRLNGKQKLLSRVFYRSRISDRIFFKRDCMEVYATSSAAFPDFPDKTILTVNFRRGLHWSELAEQIDTLLILDSNVETKAVTPEIFLRGFERVIYHFSSEAFAEKLIHVKLHPYQYVDRWFADHLIAHLRAQLPRSTIVEIDSEVSIESLSVTGHAVLYVGISSLALYASRHGRKVYSYARCIGELEPNYLNRMNLQPEAFFESVEFL